MTTPLTEAKQGGDVPIPQWVWAEVAKIDNRHAPNSEIQWARYADELRTALAERIAAHEEPPVDPLLIEAREIARTTLPYLADDSLHRAHAIREGFGDQYWEAAFIVAALRRGIELGREQGQ